MATVTWDGSSSTDWTTGANWDTGSIPTSLSNWEELQKIFWGHGSNLPLSQFKAGWDVIDFSRWKLIAGLSTAGGGGAFHPNYSFPLNACELVPHQYNADLLNSQNDLYYRFLLGDEWYAGRCQEEYYTNENQQIEIRRGTTPIKPKPTLNRGNGDLRNRRGRKRS